MMVGTTRKVKSDTIWLITLHAKATYDIEDQKYINDKDHNTISVDECE